MDLVRDAGGAASAAFIVVLDLVFAAGASIGTGVGAARAARLLLFFFLISAFFSACCIICLCTSRCGFVGMVACCGSLGSTDLDAIDLVILWLWVLSLCTLGSVCTLGSG